MRTQKGKVHATERSVAVAQELPLIQQGENILISAQLLHKQLRSGYQFADWIKRRIKEYGFVENQDFFASEKTEAKSGRGGHNRSDYFLSLDMAKELAMLERNEIGRQIRRYFIQKEKEARGISHLPKESQLFKGLKPKRINDRELYPYSEIRERAGYARHGGGAHRASYWMHFVKFDNILYVTREFALHLYHQKQVVSNRQVMQAMQPVLALDFGKGGSHA